MKISGSSQLTKIAKVRCTSKKLRKQQSPVGTLVGRTATKGCAVRTSLAATAGLRLTTALALAPWSKLQLIQLELERLDVPTCLRTSLLYGFATFSVLVFLLLLFDGGDPLPLVPSHLRERTFRICEKNFSKNKAKL